MSACSAAPEPEEAEDEGALMEDAKPVLDIPFYVGVPKRELLPLSATQSGRLTVAWVPSSATPSVGLRVVAVASAAEAARLMGTQPGQETLIRTGDVLLTFRPELASSLPLQHVQMAVTNADLAGRNTGSYLQDVKAFHVVRPRSLASMTRDTTLRSNFGRWLSLAGGAAPTNYDVSIPSRLASPAQLTAFGKQLRLGGVTGLTRAEVAYGVLALANCSEADIQNATEPPACLAAPFVAEGLVGGAAAGGAFEGPLLTAQAAGARLPLESVFHQGNLANATSGFVAASRAFEQSPLSSILRTVYATRATKPDAPLPGASPELTAPQTLPSSFLVEALKSNATRRMDYIATVLIADAAQLARAKAGASAN